MRTHRTPARHALLAVPALALPAVLLAACGGGGGGGDAEAGATGPIDIWLSNNPEEVAWGEAMVDAWNADHPDQEISAQEIPAGNSSEEVIAAAITAGNAPCLVFNTSPAAVPQFQRQGGLVNLSELEGADDYITERTGDSAEQYRSDDGDFYQMPWKANPVMIIYNKALFEQAGLDPEDPPLGTYDEFLQTSRTLVESGAAPAAIYPAPTSEFFQSWFDFYPLFAAQTGGQLLVEDGQAQFDSEAGLAVADLWSTMYEEGLSPREQYNGDSFADGQAAMAIVGPWAIAVYGEAVDWGVVPVPTEDGTAADETYTFDDAKNVAMYSSCDNRGTAWEVLRFATSQDQDAALLDATGQMPLRTDLTGTFSDYFDANPDYTTFADQTSRTVGVPIVPNSIEVWQTFRDAWTESVIFGDAEPSDAFGEAADTVDGLVQGQ